MKEAAQTQEQAEKRKIIAYRAIIYLTLFYLAVCSFCIGVAVYQLKSYLVKEEGIGFTFVHGLYSAGSVYLPYIGLHPRGAFEEGMIISIFVAHILLNMAYMYAPARELIETSFTSGIAPRSRVLVSVAIAIALRVYIETVIIVYTGTKHIWQLMNTLAGTIILATIVIIMHSKDDDKVEELNHNMKPWIYEPNH